MGNKMQPHVLRIDSKHYKAKTDKDDDYCDVTYSPRGWACACRDATRLSNRCDHMTMVLFSLGMREMARPETEESNVVEDVSQECIYCHSTNVRKHSIRHNKSGEVQRYFCRDCNRKYSHTPKTHKCRAVVEAINLHFDGVPYTQISKTIAETADTKVSEATISDWVDRYSSIVKSYVQMLTYDATLYPVKGTNRYAIHPVYFKARSDIPFVFSVLDNRTKVWIAMKMWEKQDVYGAYRPSIWAKGITSQRSTPVS